MQQKLTQICDVISQLTAISAGEILRCLLTRCPQDVGMNGSWKGPEDTQVKESKLYRSESKTGVSVSAGVRSSGIIQNNKNDTICFNHITIFGLQFNFCCNSTRDLILLIIVIFFFSLKDTNKLPIYLSQYNYESYFQRQCTPHVSQSGILFWLHWKLILDK